MKKHIYFLAAVTGIVLFLSSCHGKHMRGRGAKVTEPRTSTPFSAIDVDATLKLIVTVQPGAHPTLVLKGYKNLLEHIKTSNDSNTLRIYTDLDDSWSFSSHDNTTAEIIVPSLSALNLSGATDADIHGSVTGNDLTIEISGSGKIIIDSLNVVNFTTTVEGAANIEINSGTVQKATYDISGAGKIAAFALQASEVTTSVSGAAKADLTALKTLDINIDGAGKIKYKGHPVVTKDIEGAGSVRDVN